MALQKLGPFIATFADEIRMAREIKDGRLIAANCTKIFCSKFYFTFMYLFIYLVSTARALWHTIQKVKRKLENKQKSELKNTMSII